MKAETLKFLLIAGQHNAERGQTITKHCSMLKCEMFINPKQFK